MIINRMIISSIILLQPYIMMILILILINSIILGDGNDAENPLLRHGGLQHLNISKKE